MILGGVYPASYFLPLSSPTFVPLGRPPLGVLVADPIDASVADVIAALLGEHELVATAAPTAGHLAMYDGAYFYDGLLLYGDYAVGHQPAHGVRLAGQLGMVLT